MSSNQVIIIIEWPCDSVVASVRCERRVSQVLHRRGEWGRGRDLPEHRTREIMDTCEANGMDLYQALSLRRSMLRAQPGGMRRVSQSSQMGNGQGQDQVARLFEEAVLSYVKAAISQNDASLDLSTMLRSEKQLLQEMKSGKRPRGPTPDILFLSPVQINGQIVKWIDAKLYYASSMFANEPRIPNGKLQKTAMRYNSFYGGKGAFVFGRGFCADLTRVVTGALLLDSTPLDMTAVERFQDEQT